jgi:hypothetical protein
VRHPLGVCVSLVGPLCRGPGPSLWNGWIFKHRARQSFQVDLAAVAMHISAESAGGGIPAAMAVGLRGLGPPAGTHRWFEPAAAAIGSCRRVWADAFRGEGIDIAGSLQT